MANANKVEKENGEALSKAYYEASEIIVSCDWRIKNLVANATPKTTAVKGGSVVFRYAKGQLLYIVPTKFMTDKQISELSVVVGNPIKAILG